MKRLPHFAFMVLFLLPVSGLAQKLIEYVPMNSPIVVAVNLVTNMVYAANYNDGTVSVMDGNTNAVVATIPVGPMPFSLAVNPVTNLIYVSNTGSPQGTGMSIMAIDGNLNSVVSMLPLPRSYPGFIAVNPLTNTVYFTLADGSPFVVAMNAATNQIVAKVQVKGRGCCRGMALNSATSRLYLAIEDPFNETSYIAVMNTVNNRLVSKITPPGLQFVGAVAVDSGLNRVYASDGVSNLLFVIDGADGSVIATLPYFSDSMAVNENTHVIAVASDKLTFIDGLTDEVVGGQVPFAACSCRINLGAGIDDHFYVGYDNFLNDNAPGALGVYSGPPSQ